VSIQAVEALLPCSSGVLGPGGDLDQRLGPQLAWPPLAISAATDQTRLLEDLQMTGDGREADREGFGQLQHRCLTVDQPTHDRAPRGSDKAAKTASNRSGAVTGIVAVPPADTS
jgi:hypothetical protein